MVCSVPCESKKAPSIHFVRHGARHEIYGCPGKHLCGSVRKFHADLHLQKEGVMERYSHQELPAKYAELIPAYEDWFGFFSNRQEKIESGNVPNTQRQIDEFRRKEGRR